jgi:CRP/FNR family transcriptional regulator, cyclic AMP receptor protein
MLRKDAKVELISKIPLFSECRKKELASIASLADLVEMPAGMRLVNEGALDRDLIVIVEGSVEVRRGKRKVATLDAGQFFGEIALISGGPRSATVTATSPVSLLVIREQQFRLLVEKTPSILASVLQVVGERLQPAAV